MTIAVMLELAKRYLPQLIAVLLIITVLWYLEHSIYESGYAAGRSEERMEWIVEKEKADEEARQVLEKHKLAYEAELSKQRTILIGVFNESENLRNKLVNDLAESAKHRMYVNTKVTTCDRGASKSKAADTGGIGGPGEKVYRAELDRETEQNIRRDYAEVAAGANACKVLLDLVENNFEVIR